MFEVREDVFAEYRNIVKGNDRTDNETISKKLNRNIILADEFKHDGYTHFYYGKLRITVRKGKIVKIKNNTNHNGSVNKTAKIMLDDLLGIKERVNEETV